MSPTPAAGSDGARLALAIGAAAFSVIGVAVVSLALVVLLVAIAPRLTWFITGGSGGIGTIRVGLSVTMVTILMLIFIAAAAFVALRVFKMVRAGHAATD